LHFLFRAVALLLFASFLDSLGVAQSIVSTYEPAATKLIDASLADTEGYDNLKYLCYHIGNRISGSDALLRAIAWSAETMRKDGLSNVRVQPVMVPRWVRGRESAAIVSPTTQPLHMLGLGMSVGTPPEGITAPVVVVSDFASLAKLGRSGVNGKIVLYDAPFQGYRQTVMYRTAGPAEAAALGAVAVLVRSITPLAMEIPHTGTTVYDPKQPKIPAAAITIEDAMLLSSLCAEGKSVTVHLQMEAHLERDVEAGNVMAEIVGTEHPEQVVVLGGHIDSWDVGQGAQDDGSGIMAALEAVNIIRRSGLKPKRTIRVVFWVNEENGTAGGRAYLQMVSRDLDNQVAAIEMDGGAEAPIGYGYGVAGANRRATPGNTATGAEAPLTAGQQASLATLQQIANLLAPIGADKISIGGGGTDIAPIMAQGVPGMSEMTTGAHYLDWHHSEADTLDKVDPADFRKNIASLAVMSFVLADMPGRLTGQLGAGE